MGGQRRLVIPTELEIEGVRWRVYRESEAPKRFRIQRPMLAHGHKGLTSFNHCAIVLADGLAPDDLEETFIHELIHALLASDSMFGYDLQEYVAEYLDGPLSRVLRRLRYQE